MRRLVAISLFLMLCHLAMAQAFMRKVPNLDFANFADNRIDFFTSVIARCSCSSFSLSLSGSPLTSISGDKPTWSMTFPEGV